MLRTLLALIIIASAYVVMQKLGLLNSLLNMNSSEISTIQKPQTKIDAPSSVEQQPPKKKNVTTSEVYRWVDEKGKVHFSDKVEETAIVDPKKVTISTETTEFAITPKIRPVFVPSNRQTSSSSSRSDRCKSLKAQIAKDEKRLRRAGRIPAQNRQLSEKRWQAIKGC